MLASSVQFKISREKWHGKRPTYFCQLTCRFWELDLTVSTWKLSNVLSMQKLFLQLHKVTDNVTPTRSCLFVFYITIYLRKLSSVLLLLGLIENSERTKLNWCFSFPSRSLQKVSLQRKRSFSKCKLLCHCVQGIIELFLLHFGKCHLY